MNGPAADLVRRGARCKREGNWRGRDRLLAPRALRTRARPPSFGLAYTQCVTRALCKHDRWPISLTPAWPSLKALGPAGAPTPASGRLLVKAKLGSLNLPAMLHKAVVAAKWLRPLFRSGRPIHRGPLPPMNGGLLVQSACVLSLSHNTSVNYPRVTCERKGGRIMCVGFGARCHQKTICALYRASKTRVYV